MGKTFVAAALLRTWRKAGLRVAARKPAQSFEPSERTDADVLAEASGESPIEVCPLHRWYDVPMAPPMAAEVLGRPPFTLADLVADLRWPKGLDVGLIEGAGGPRSPLASDGDTVDLAWRLRPDVVLVVADAGLGTINAARLSVVPFAPLPVVVHLNRYDPAEDLHRRNAAYLVGRCDLRVTTSVDALARAVIL